MPSAKEFNALVEEDLAYLDKHGIASMLETALNEVIRNQPRKPIPYLCKIIGYLGAPDPEPEPEPEIELSKNIGSEKFGAWKAVMKAKKNFASRKPYFVEVNGAKVKIRHNKGKNAGKLSSHLTEALYARLNEKTTPGGVHLDKVIKMGIENPSHPVGLVAPDVDSYSVFTDLFSPVIRDLHNVSSLENAHVSDSAHENLSDCTGLDPDYVTSCTVMAPRALAGLPLPPGCSDDDRKAIEGAVATALGQLGAFTNKQEKKEKTEEKKDDTFLTGEEGEEEQAAPKKSKKAKTPKKGGKQPALPAPEIVMTADDWAELKTAPYTPLSAIPKNEQRNLRKEGLLFPEPRAVEFISAGMHVDWPDGRGVAFTRDKTVSVWVNERNHIKIISRGFSDLRKTFVRFVSFHRALQLALEAGGHKFALDPNLGYLATCPSDLGTGVRAVVECSFKANKVNQLANFPDLVARHHLTVLSAAEDGSFTFTNVGGLGLTEVQIVNKLIDGVGALIELDKLLASGFAPRKSPPHILYGSWLAVEKAKAEFLVKKPYLVTVNERSVRQHHNPEDLPKHVNCLDKCLTEAIYKQLKDTVTSNGVTLDRCIKPGVENIGDRGLKTPGVYAGDLECYTVFKPLFDRVIKARHGTKSGIPKHKVDLNFKNVKDVVGVDGDCVVGCSIQVTRSLVGHVLSPSCTGEERKKVEKALVAATKKLEGTEFQLKYVSLAKASEEGKKKLREEGVLFPVPHHCEVISAGTHRDWPEGRGCAMNEARNVILWINEKDHLKIIVRENGPNIKKAFARFCKFNKVFSKALGEDGHTFAQNEELGFLNTSLDDLGGALRACYTCRFPQLAKKNLKKIAIKANLEPIEYSSEDGAFELRNNKTLGQSEVEIVNFVVQNVAKIIKEEERLTPKEGAGSPKNAKSPNNEKAKTPKGSKTPKSGKKKK